MHVRLDRERASNNWQTVLNVVTYIACLKLLHCSKFSSRWQLALVLQHHRDSCLSRQRDGKAGKATVAKIDSKSLGAITMWQSDFALPVSIENTSISRIYHCSFLSFSSSSLKTCVFVIHFGPKEDERWIIRSGLFSTFYFTQTFFCFFNLVSLRLKSEDLIEHFTV